MTEVYIAGAAMTQFGAFPELSVFDLVNEAVGDALADAGCDHDQVRGGFYSGMTNGFFQGQHSIPGQVNFSRIGLRGIPMFNVESACASGSVAVHLAYQYIRSGAADIVLVAGGEKMSGGEKAQALSLFESGWDVEHPEANRASFLQMGSGVCVPDGFATGDPYSAFMDVYAGMARWHMRTYGTSMEDFAAVSAKNHVHSVHNNKAQFRMPLTAEQVLGAKPIVYPLTAPMCAPLSDGAAALVLTSRSGLERLSGSSDRVIHVAASVVRSATARDADDPEQAVGTLTAAAAYEQAGLGPDDIDVAEVHDASAVGEMLQVENLKLAPRGEAGAWARNGDLSIGGRMPVNPSGGLESKGHPLGATGIAQLYELVQQLRGEAGKRQVGGAQTAIQENGGGVIGVEEAALAVHILTRRN
ncbi:thiolase family protein [Gordonia malaquae]|uniref:thiolase family protein n=1 Tax=Gordonia malaquae TaxID=410332 RepID=UPI0030FEC804